MENTLNHLSYITKLTIFLLKESVEIRDDMVQGCKNRKENDKVFLFKLIVWNYFKEKIHQKQLRKLSDVQKARAIV